MCPSVGMCIVPSRGCAHTIRAFHGAHVNLLLMLLNGTYHNSIYMTCTCVAKIKAPSSNRRQEAAALKKWCGGVISSEKCIDNFEQ